MRFLIALAVACFIPVAAAQSVAEAFCGGAKRSAADIQDQLPVQVDVGTKWVGASAVYAGGVCRVSHEYLIDSAVIVDMALEAMNKQTGHTTRQEVVDFYRSEKGAEDLKQTMRKTVLDYFGEALEYPNIQVRVHYGASDPIEPFTIVLESEDSP